MAAIERKWVEDRDAFLVECFAEGKHAFDILRECQEHGYDLSKDGLEAKRKELRPRILARIGPLVNKRLDRIKRAHPAARVHEADELADMLWEGIVLAKDNNMWTVVSRLGDALLRTHNIIRKEVDAGEQHEEVNPMVEIMRATPPEKRALLVETLQRHRDELRSVLSPVLSFESADADDVIDAEVVGNAGV